MNTVRIEKYMYINALALLLLFISCAAGISDSQSLVAVSDLVASSDYVYVADGNTLHVFHANLTRHSSLTVGNSAVSKVALNIDDTFIIVSSVDGLCRTYEIDSLLATEPNSVVFRPSIMATIPTVRKIALGATSNSTFFVGSEGHTTRSGGRAIILSQFEYDWSAIYQLRTSEALIITSSSFISREFFDVFKHGQFVYYIAMDSTGDKNRLIVMRVCDDRYDEHFSAVTEVELDCEITAPTFNVTYSSLICNPNNANQTSEELLVTTSSMSGSQVCSYHLADIDREMQRVYNECISTSNKIPLPWATDDYTEDCSRFTERETTECNFGSTNTPSFIRALAARSSVSGRVVLETSDKITASLTLRLDNIPLLYVVHITNTSGYYLTKYLIMKDMTLNLLKTETINGSGVVRYLKHNDKFIYAATDNEVFTIALNDCSSYNDCKSCIKSTPLCGWCALEGMCSRKTNCQKPHLRNRWISNSSSCISHITLLQPHSAVTPLIVNVTVMPTSATFPDVDVNEKYSCHFAANAQNYSFTLPFVNGKYCDPTVTLIPNFDFEQIQLDFSILPLVNNTNSLKSFKTNYTLTIHNCSINSRCSDCEAMGVCGWCIYDKTCTGSNTLCHTSIDWRSTSVQTGSGCPALLTPTRGWYLLPEGVSNKLQLYTRNLPSLIPGYKYTCELRYPSGLTTVTNTTYNTPSNGTQIQCQIKYNQITIPESSTTGVVALQLNLVLASEDGSLVYVIEWENRNRDDNTYFDDTTMEAKPTSEPPVNQSFPNMLVFNCSYFGHDCSSCIAATSGTDFPCVWCHSGNPNSGRCVHFSECIVMVSITNEGVHLCPAPNIMSISPTSGHIDGGTNLTITGSNLGIAVHDVRVFVGMSECTLIQSHYKPGKRIVCTTSRASSQGEVTITVMIMLQNSQAQPKQATYGSFNYALPHITSVFPRYGPVGGGTVVTISGSALDVGNTENITVTISEEICEIIDITYTELKCETTRKHSHGLGIIFIEYGDARVDGGNYLYTPNPTFTSIFPHNTIPAGGIALTFTGHNLNATQSPRIVVYLGNNSYTNTCRTTENTSLHCIAPSLPSLMNIREIVQSQRQTRSRDGDNDIILNYTLTMDNAPGPSIDDEDLLLTVKPNPIITEVQEDSRTYTIGSEETITIIGRYLDTVDMTEIKVHLGEQMCKPTSVTPVILKCKPNISTIATTQNKEIKVLIANTLEYNIGHIQLINNDKVDNGFTLETIIISIVAVIIVMITVSCIIIITTCICMRRKYSRETQVKAETYNFGSLDQENIYDHITEDTSKSTHNSSTTCIERKLNNYPYKTNEEPNPRAREKNTNVRSNLSQIPQDEYVEMQSHCVQLQKERHTTSNLHYQHQPSRIGSTGEYVDMLPASTQNRGSSMRQSECMYSVQISEDYADVEDMTVTETSA